MDLFSLIFFLMLYYIRPQEWNQTIAVFQPVKLSIILAVVALFHRHRGLGWRDFFKTPHDWIMAAYLFWIVFAANAHFATFKEVYSLFVFYWVTAITLSNVRRIQTFLIWWAVMILIVAGLAVASLYGFDPFNSAQKTEWAMKGRLILNTSIFNNPNALGHSVVPVILMLYFIGVWGRPIFLSVTFPFVMALPLSCLWLTQSKGAFISGFATLVNALSFNRPKSVQLLIWTLAGTLGLVGIQFLPRMQELDETKGNVAIQGRVAAFRFGLDAMKNRTYGVGYKRFALAFFDENRFYKAAHSSYVNVGAELGKVGLYLFVGILYCCLRTLFHAKTGTRAEERVRRILFALLISYMISSWMVSWSDRGIFFLMVGAIAAFHRQLMEETPLPQQQQKTESGIQFSPALSVGRLQPALAGEPVVAYAAGQLAVPVPEPLPKTGDAVIEAESVVVRQPGVRWNRITLLDLFLILLMTLATVRFWMYVMTKM